MMSLLQVLFVSLIPASYRSLLTGTGLQHIDFTCAVKPGCLMSHNWLHTPDCMYLHGDTLTTSQAIVGLIEKRLNIPCASL